MPVRPPRAIPRNAIRQITPLRIRLTYCIRFSSENEFRGQACDPRHAWQALDNDPKAKLHAKPFTTEEIYIVRVSQEKWFELSANERPADSAPLPRVPARRKAPSPSPREAAESVAITVDNDDKNAFSVCEPPTSSGKTRKSQAYFFMTNNDGDMFVVTVAKTKGGTSQ
jgi:hypothetical protein